MTAIDWLGAVRKSLAAAKNAGGAKNEGSRGSRGSRGSTIEKTIDINCLGGDGVGTHTGEVRVPGVPAIADGTPGTRAALSGVPVATAHNSKQK